MYYRNETLIYLISYSQLCIFARGVLLKGLLEVFTFQFSLIQYIIVSSRKSSFFLCMELSTFAEKCLSDVK